MEGYKLKVENGRLKIEGQEHEYLLLPVEIVSKIRDSLMKIVGEAGARVTLREIGKAVGNALAEVVGKELSAQFHTSGTQASLEQLCEAVSDYLQKAGFGNVIVEKEGGKIKLTIYYPPSLRARSSGTKMKCNFEMGLVKGALEAVSKKRMNVTLDESVNDEKCVIYVAPSS